LPEFARLMNGNPMPPVGFKIDVSIKRTKYKNIISAVGCDFSSEIEGGNPIYYSWIISFNNVGKAGKWSDLILF